MATARCCHQHLILSAGYSCSKTGAKRVVSSLITAESVHFVNSNQSHQKPHKKSPAISYRNTLTSVDVLVNIITAQGERMSVQYLVITAISMTFE